MLCWVWQPEEGEAPVVSPGPTSNKSEIFFPVCASTWSTWIHHPPMYIKDMPLRSFFYFNGKLEVVFPGFPGFPGTYPSNVGTELLSF